MEYLIVPLSLFAVQLIIIGVIQWIKPRLRNILQDLSK